VKLLRKSVHAGTAKQTPQADATRGTRLQCEEVMEKMTKTCEQKRFEFSKCVCAMALMHGGGGFGDHGSTALTLAITDRFVTSTDAV
jgi:hypothetical protein